MTEDVVQWDIAVVASTPYSGGAEKYIARMGQALSRRGVAIGLLGEVHPWMSEAALPFRPISLGPKWSLKTVPVQVLRLPFEMAALRRGLVGIEARVFNCHFKREQIGFTRELAKRGKVYWTEHGVFPSGAFGRLIAPLYRRSAKRASAILCVSEVVRADIERVVRGACPVLTVNTGIQARSAQSREAALKQLGLEKRGFDAPTCAFVGRMTVDKRPGLAVEAALAAKFNIIVAGGGPELVRLRQKFGDDPRVALLGEIPNADVVFDAADVHLFTSTGRGEGFPTVILEAAREGLPTVGACGTGFEDMVSAAGGQVAPPQVSDLAASIIEVYHNESLVEKARGFAGQHTEEAWAASYIAALGLSNSVGSEEKLGKLDA